MITIIPAIDIIDGKCVRLTQGKYNTLKVYNSNPLEVARKFEEAGMKRLHLVDLDGAKGEHVINLNILEQLASKTNLEIDFGGGIKGIDDLQNVFNAGAKFATIGSLAVNKKAIVKQWIQEYGSEKFIIGIDTWNGVIKTRGWQEEAKTTLVELLQFFKSSGVRKFMMTDITRDGKLQGLDIDYYRNLKQKHPELKLIASGGVSSMHDIEALEKVSIDGVVVGKAIYENIITLDELKKYNVPC